MQQVRVVEREAVSGDFRVSYVRDASSPAARWVEFAGPEGTITLMYYTTNDDFTPAVHRVSGIPLLGDLGFHSYTQRHEWLGYMDKCGVVPGQKHCYYEGTSYQAELLIRRWSEVGYSHRWILAELFKVYKDYYNPEVLPRLEEEVGGE